MDKERRSVVIYPGEEMQLALRLADCCVTIQRDAQLPDTLHVAAWSEEKSWVTDRTEIERLANAALSALDGAKHELPAVEAVRELSRRAEMGARAAKLPRHRSIVDMMRDDRLAKLDTLLAGAEPPEGLVRAVSDDAGNPERPGDWREGSWAMDVAKDALLWLRETLKPEKVITAREIAEEMAEPHTWSNAEGFKKAEAPRETPLNAEEAIRRSQERCGAGMRGANAFETFLCALPPGHSGPHSPFWRLSWEDETKARGTTMEPAERIAADFPVDPPTSSVSVFQQEAAARAEQNARDISAAGVIPIPIGEKAKILEYLEAYAQMSAPVPAWHLRTVKAGIEGDAHFADSITFKIPPYEVIEEQERADAAAKTARKFPPDEPWFAGLSMEEVHAMILSGRAPGSRQDGGAVVVPTGFLDWLASGKGSEPKFGPCLDCGQRRGFNPRATTLDERAGFVGNKAASIAADGAVYCGTCGWPVPADGGKAAKPGEPRLRVYAEGGRVIISITAEHAKEWVEDFTGSVYNDPEMAAGLTQAVADVGLGTKKKEG